MTVRIITYSCCFLCILLSFLRPVLSLYVITAAPAALFILIFVRGHRKDA